MTRSFAALPSGGVPPCVSTAAPLLQPAWLLQETTLQRDGCAGGQQLAVVLPTQLCRHPTERGPGGARLGAAGWSWASLHRAASSDASIGCSLAECSAWRHLAQMDGIHVLCFSGLSLCRHGAGGHWTRGTLSTWVPLENLCPLLLPSKLLCALS